MNCNRIISDNTCNIIVQNDPFSDLYVYVYILLWNPSNRDLVKSQMVIKESIEDDVIFNIGEDGFYTLCTIPIPLDKSNAPEGKTKICYYEGGKFYLYDNEIVSEITVPDILELDPEESNVDATYEYYFSTCWLRKCYIKHAQDILDSHNSNMCTMSNVDRDSIYKRDLIWSALNIILYMIEFDLYEEALRVLERIEGCNGLCERSKTQEGNCGCGR